MTADRNVVWGVIALQTGFIDRDQLAAALTVWLLDKSKSLGRVLVEQRAVTGDDYSAIDLLVERHLAKHGGEAERSLIVLGTQLPAIDDSPTAEQLAGAIGPAAGDRYRILRPHARGAIGQVSLALDAELNREVALKEILPHRVGDPASRVRFVREAEITGGLEHPGIVPIYSLGHYPDGKPFYAMRFIRGDSLAEAITRFHGPGLRPTRRRGTWRSGNCWGGSSTCARRSVTPTRAACCTAT